MRSSERGVAQVNILWPIFLLVLLLGTGFALWASMGTIELERQKAVDAESERAQFESRYEESAKGLQELSKVVGYFDETTGVRQAEPATITERITRLREAAVVGSQPIISNDVTTLEGVIARLNDAVVDANTNVSTKDSSLQQAQSARDQAQSDLGTMTSTKDGEIGGLRNEVADLTSKNESDRQDLQSRIDGLQSQLDDAQAQARDAEDRLAAAEAEAKKEMETLNGRISELSSKLAVLAEPDQPDGKILNVSQADQLVYIDLGAQDMLRRGSRFKVFDYGKGGVLREKGWIEVRDVEADVAKAGIVSQRSDLDPIVAGDVIAAPYYDKNLPRNFALIGRMPAGFDRSFITQRLTALGASVDDAVSVQTDFLVVGEKELDEFAVDPTETEEYQKAEKFGVQILSAEDLLSFIRY